MKRAFIPIAALAGLFAIGSAAFAGIDTSTLDNSSFAQGKTGWEASDSVIFNSGGDLKFDRDSIAYDPTGIGESGYLRQVVDASRSPYWNPSMNHGIGELSFWTYSTGTGYMQVGFGWWDSNSRTKPTPGTAVDHFELLPTKYYSVDEWTQQTVSYDWLNKPGNSQPKWISLEFFYFDCSGVGNESAVDEISFTARSVPEPSSLLAMFGGLAGLGGVAIRRRRS